MYLKNIFLILQKKYFMKKISLITSVIFIVLTSCYKYRKFEYVQTYECNGVHTEKTVIQYFPHRRDKITFENEVKLNQKQCVDAQCNCWIMYTKA